MGSKTKRLPRPKSRKRLYSNFKKGINIPMKSFHSQQSVNKDNQQDDYFKSNSIIQKSRLLDLLKQTLCINCLHQWNGQIICRKREGLHEYLELICFNCKQSLSMSTSDYVKDTRRHAINVRVQLGAHLAGIGHSGLMKLFACMNLPPPIDGEYYTSTNDQLVDVIRIHQQMSMSRAVEEATRHSGSSTLTVSGDGSWITRGRTSAHGIAELCSTTTPPKVIDIERSSKLCSQCMGAEAFRRIDPEKYEIFMTDHRCDINYVGASGSMEKSLISQLFKRSMSKYNVQYDRYIGDGDAKVHKSLLDDPPYDDIVVAKIEDTNHYAKRLYNRCKKLKNISKTKVLSDGLKVSGHGRLTDQHLIKFKSYLSKAIRDSKGDLNVLFGRAQAIFYHYYSTDKDPQHHYCDVKWCKYLQDRESYDHSQHSIPRACMNVIKPAFDEICSKNSLRQVVHGGSQNANETFHSILWTIAPKHRYASAVMIDIAIGIAVMIYNDGYMGLADLFNDCFNSCGYYTEKGFANLDASANHHEQKLANRRIKQRRKKEQTSEGTYDDITDTDLDENTDSDDYLYALASSDDDAYEPGGDALE